MLVLTGLGHGAAPAVVKHDFLEVLLDINEVEVEEEQEEEEKNSVSEEDDDNPPELESEEIELELKNNGSLSCVSSDDDDFII